MGAKVVGYGGDRGSDEEVAVCQADALAVGGKPAEHGADAILGAVHVKLLSLGQAGNELREDLADGGGARSVRGPRHGRDHATVLVAARHGGEERVDVRFWGADWA